MNKSIEPIRDGVKISFLNASRMRCSVAIFACLIAHRTRIRSQYIIVILNWIHKKWIALFGSLIWFRIVVFHSAFIGETTDLCNHMWVYVCVEYKNRIPHDHLRKCWINAARRACVLYGFSVQFDRYDTLYIRIVSLLLCGRTFSVLANQYDLCCVRTECQSITHSLSHSFNGHRATYNWFVPHCIPYTCTDASTHMYVDQHRANTKQKLKPHNE